MKKYKIKSNANLSNLAGKWEMSDKEAEEFMKTLKKGWRKWTE